MQAVQDDPGIGVDVGVAVGVKVMVGVRVIVGLKVSVEVMVGIMVGVGATGAVGVSFFLQAWKKRIEPSNMVKAKVVPIDFLNIWFPAPKIIDQLTTPLTAI